MRKIEIDSGHLYKLAIYFGIATLHFYRKDVIPLNEGETFGSFAEKNKTVLKRVFDETLALGQYELSHEQMGSIIKGYTSNSTSINEVGVGGETLQPA